MRPRVALEERNGDAWTRERRRTLALMAQEIGAAVISGRVRYRGREGGLEIGGTGLEEVLWELEHQEVMLITVPLGPTQELPARRSRKTPGE